MKVIYLITKLLRGQGPVNQAYNLATAMRHLGADFTIVCISPEVEGKSWQDKFDKAGINVVHLNKRAKDVSGTLKALKKYIKDNQVEIVHSSGLRPDLYNVLLGNRVRHYTTQRCEPRNIMEKSGKMIARISERLMMYSLGKMDKVIACSQALEEHLKKECHLDATHVQNGVDVDYFRPLTNEEKLKVRKELGLPTDKKIFLYCGMFYERKDLHTLLKGFCKLFEQDKNKLLVVAGGSPVEVDQYSKQYDSPNIVFLGQINEPLRYIQCADFSISASLSEGLPNSILESMACGVPVVLSDIGPHKELNVGKRIGEYFTTGNIDDMILAISRIEESDYQAMKNNCIDTVDKCFSKYATAGNYIEKYNEPI